MGVASRTVISLVTRKRRIVIARNGKPRINVVGRTFRTTTGARTRSPVLPVSIYITLDRNCVNCSLRGTLERRLLSQNVGGPMTALIARIRISTGSPTFLGPAGPVNSFFARRRTRRLAGRNCALGRSTNHNCHHIITSPGPISVVRGRAIGTLMSTNRIIVAINNNNVPIVHRNGRLHNTDTIVSGS